MSSTEELGNKVSFVSPLPNSIPEGEGAQCRFIISSIHNTHVRFAVGECALGALLLAMSEHGVCTISLGDDRHSLVDDLQDQFPQAELLGGDKESGQLLAKLVGFIEAPYPGFDLPLDIQGTVFQQSVWQALREIPVGATITYTELAHRIGAPKSVRAVASACAANTLAVAIPCHRVVRIDGSLSGYRWGTERKAELLRRESVGRVRYDSGATGMVVT